MNLEARMISANLRGGGTCLMGAFREPHSDPPPAIEEGQPGELDSDETSSGTASDLDK